MRLAGFGKIQVYTDRLSPFSIALGWMTPVMYVASRLAVKAFRRKAHQHCRAVAPREVISEIFDHVFSPALLFGKRMIVTSVRE
jgi:hypothetical protein